MHTKSKLEPSGPEGIRSKLAYKSKLKPSGPEGMAQICIRNRSWSSQDQRGYGANLHAKSKLKPSGPEGILRKFAYEIQAETFKARGDTAQICTRNRSWNSQDQRGYGANLHTKSKLKPLGPEGIQRKFAYNIEADTLKARGDTAQICIRNRS